LTGKPTTSPTNRSYGKLAKVGLLWGFLREATNSVILLPTTVIMARLLSPEEFGIAAIAYFVLALGSRLTQFGFNTALLRAKNVRPEHTSSVFVLNIILGAICWCTVTALAPALTVFLRNEHVRDVIPIAGLTFFISAFGTVPRTLLSRELRFRENATSDWLGTITNSFVAIFLAWKGFGFWSIVYGHLANDVVRTMSIWYFSGWRPRFIFSTAAVRELFSFGVGVYTKNLLDYLVQNLDNLIVGRVLGLAALGLYDKAFNLVSKTVGRINLAGPSVSFRIFALIHEEPERFRRAYRKVIMTVTVVGYPIFTGLIVLATGLFQLLFGSRWLPAVPAFQILCAAGMIKLLNTYASSAAQAKGMIWSEVRRQLLSTVILVASVAILCHWGIAGAATGVLLATAFTTFLMQRLIRRLTGFAWRDLIAPQVPAVTCSVGLAVVLASSRFALQEYGGNPAPWLMLLIVATIGGVYYCAFLLFSGFSEVRETVWETLDDLAPFAARRIRAFTSTRSLAALVGR
jgi:teichuronic acid exporter